MYSFVFNAFKLNPFCGAQVMRSTTGKIVHKLSGPKDKVNCLAHDSGCLAAACDDFNTYIWDSTQFTSASRYLINSNSNQIQIQI